MITGMEISTILLKNHAIHNKIKNMIYERNITFVAVRYGRLYVSAAVIRL